MRKLAIPFLAAAIAGCGTETLTSRWQDRERDGDGRIADWAGATTTLADGSLTVGVLNDAEHLYLYLRPETRSAAMALYRQGFTLWFGEGEERFGLLFPVANRLMADDGMLPGGEPPSAGRGGRRRGGRGEDPDAPAMRVPAPELKLVDLLDASGEPVRGGRIAGMRGMSLVEFPGASLPAVQVSVDLGPPSADSISLNATPGDRIRVALITPKLERPSLGGMGGDRSAGDRPSRGPGGGGFPGGGGQPPGGGFPGGGPGGRPPGGGFSPPKPFDISAFVTLARPEVDPALE